MIQRRAGELNIELKLRVGCLDNNTDRRSLRMDIEAGFLYIDSEGGEAIRVFRSLV